MTLHLQKFVDRVVGHEARGSRDFVMSMADAKNLHADITRLLLELRDLRENATKPVEQDVIEIKVNGGKF